MLNKINKLCSLGHTRNLRSSLLLVNIFAMILTGCASSVNPNYYTLAPKVTPIQGTPLRIIEILPIGLPDRLDRVSIMVNTDQGQSNILDNNRWTSTLSTELHDSLSASLQQQLNAVDRYTSGISTTNTVYRIAIDFSRFDIIKPIPNHRNGSVEVAVSWMIKPIEPLQTSTTSKQPIHRLLNCRMSFSQEIANSDSVTDMVNASKLAVNQVTTGVSDAVFAVEKGTTPRVNHAVCS